MHALACPMMYFHQLKWRLKMLKTVCLAWCVFHIALAAVSAENDERIVSCKIGLFHVFQSSVKTLHMGWFNLAHTRSSLLYSAIMSLLYIAYREMDNRPIHWFLQIISRGHFILFSHYFPSLPSKSAVDQNDPSLNYNCCDITDLRWRWD